MDPTPNPHDRFFRESFGRRDIARDFLRHHLPEELLAQLDLETLTIAKDSYVTKELRTSYSDLVYRVGWHEDELHIYLLFEHKSQPDRWAALQILRYVVLSSEQYRKQHPKARHLPPVYPLVFYHGQSRWQMPRSFQELVQPLPPILAPYVPQFRYALHDLSPRSDEEIRGEVLTRLVQLALRHIHDREPAARLPELLGLIARVIDQEPTALELLEALLRYYVQGTQRLDEGAVRELLTALPAGGDIMQTFIDHYIEEGQRRGLQTGLRQGRQEGRQEGLQNGLRQGQAVVLLRQLELKFGPPGEMLQQRVHQADPETLLRWSERILAAQTLDEVFD